MLINDARRHAFHVLDTHTLPPEAAAKLAALGITTLAELRDHWQYGNRQLILNFLGDSPLRFVAASATAMLATRGPGAGPGNVVNLLEATRTGPLVRHPRGVIVSNQELKAAATMPESLKGAARTATRSARGAVAGTAPKVSLISKFPAIRHQKDRGTCVAFSSVAFLEFHLSEQKGSAVPRHSEQFVYWACKEADGMAKTEGTFVSTAREVLKDRGACRNSTWKYNPLPISNNEGQGPPPAGAKNEAKASRWNSAKAVAAKNPAKIRAQLDADKPVVLSVKTFSSWDYPSVAQTGEIPMPIPGSNSDGGHAICVVGYELNANVPGGGAFIIRNSWGSAWGKPQGRFGGGYGTLFFEYVKKHGLEAYA
jgi:C1A family cysteine protease